MAQTEWIVFTCRACRGLIKLSPGLAVGGSVICPQCRTKIPVPKDAAHVEMESEGSQLPSARNSEPGVTNLRGALREEWEVGNKPIGGDLEFREKLHQTSESEFRDDPDNPVMKRVNMRRRKYERTHRDFDEPEQAGEASGSEPHRGRRKGARRHYKNKGREFADTFVRLLIGAVVVLAGIAGWLAYERYKRKAAQPPPRPTYSQAKDELAQDPDGPRLENRAIADFAPALGLVARRFASAVSVEEMLPLLRDRQRVEPLVRAYYNELHTWEPFEIRNKFDPADVATIDGNFVHVDLVMLNYEPRPIALERHGESFLVDWESFVGYGEVEWPDLVKQRPEKPVLMRVFLEQSPATAYYNEDFADERKWDCFLMRDRTGSHQFSAYVARGSETDIALKKRMYQGTSSQQIRRAAVVVKLRFAAGGKSLKQMEITQFLENGWVFREGNDLAPPPAPPLPAGKGPELWPDGQKEPR